jgi:hypothetical protein
MVSASTIAVVGFIASGATLVAALEIRKSSKTLQERILPYSGPSGTVFVLSGSGFPPSSLQSFIVTGPGGIITTQQFPVPVDANGNFAPVSIPYNPLGAGTYTLTWTGGVAPSLTFIET